MKKILSLLCVVVCLVAGVVGQRNMWEQADRTHPAKSFSFRVSLSQSNLDVLESTLLDVSSPRSPNYGKWWTYEQVQDLVAPPKETTERIVSFFSSKNFIVVNHRDSLKVTASVKEIEELFQIKLFTFLHKTEKQMIVRAVEQYTVPAEIASDVDMIAGLLEFPEVRKQAIQGIDDDDRYVVPAVINYLYQIPDNFPTHPNSSLCLVEFQGDQSISYNDITNFTSLNEIPSFSVAHVVGTFNGTDVESTLDVEYGAAIAQKAQIWYWTEATWMYEFSVDLLATNSPPLVVSMSWGWPEPDQCEIDKSDPDCKLFSKNSQKYVDKTNVEFQKAGLLGITLLAASGDQGAPGDDNPECNPIKIHKLSSIFPGASPWVLSVGATMLNNETSANIPVPPLCSYIPCTNWTSEETCSVPTALITSGGGFSNYVAQPSYQKSVVDSYLSSGVPLPPSFFFNKDNRAFPDVAALGHNYIIYIDQNWSVVDGTSASTPVWAGIIALLNSYRLNNNKTPLGFIVPLIYEAYASDPSIFTDITIGNNKCTEDCCSKYGYEAAVGWDPVTGLGSPVFPKLLKYVASLP